ncbi:MAG: hypothetical protein C1943_19500 [Halochromatium sp.]|nr:hypothetical protein [Halochromatium sp.]
MARVKPPAGIDALYSLCISQARRTTTWRDGVFRRLLSIAPDQDSSDGKKSALLDGERLAPMPAQDVQRHLTPAEALAEVDVMQPHAWVKRIQHSSNPSSGR